MKGWVNVFKAQFFANICWFRNNRWMLLSNFVWPYLMVGLLLGIGLVFGSLETYGKRVGVSSPILFLLSSTVVAMSSLSIVFSVAGFVMENKWMGTLPYIMLTPFKTPVLLIAAGLPDAIMLPMMNMAAIMPAAVYFKGILGGLRVIAVLALILLSMLPLLGLSALIASPLLIMREETHIGQMIAPLILLVSGIYYPLEVLPWVLRFIGEALPITYVVEATKLLSTYAKLDVKLMLIPVYVLTAMTLGYNLLASLTLGRVEKAVKKRGVI